MSMPTFNIDRAGDHFSATQQQILEKAKDELRTAFSKKEERHAPR
jgi:hypothetical protein